MLSRKFDDVAKNAMGVALLSLLCVVYGDDARGQTPSPSDPNPKEMHGGIVTADTPQRKGPASTGRRTRG